MAMKISCAALGWGDIKDVKQFVEILDSIKDAGYEGVGIEYAVMPEVLKKNPARVKKLAKQAGLEVVSMALNETTTDMADVAKKMGAESGWLCLFEKDDKSAAKVTKALTVAFGEKGMKIAVHPHVRSNAENLRQLDALLKASHAGICFDSAHLEALRIDLPKFIAKYKGSIVLVHLKDLREHVDPAKIDYDKDFVDLGEGVVDMPAVALALKKARYKGWIMVEVDFPHKGSMAESAKKNYKYLQKLMKD
ncbi:MAG: sugar phosphate isomerase/epimerase [Thaumarchaeota archaeon]|nr:sugar phosphate isomerase/epimerase [Nitrososphaerota archaeon]